MAGIHLQNITPGALWRNIDEPWWEQEQTVVVEERAQEHIHTDLGIRWLTDVVADGGGNEWAISIGSTETMDDSRGEEWNLIPYLTPEIKPRERWNQDCKAKTKGGEGFRRNDKRANGLRERTAISKQNIPKGKSSGQILIKRMALEGTTCLRENGTLDKA